MKNEKNIKEKIEKGNWKNLNISTLKLKEVIWQSYFKITIIYYNIIIFLIQGIIFLYFYYNDIKIINEESLNLNYLIYILIIFLVLKIYNILTKKSDKILYFIIFFVRILSMIIIINLILYILNLNFKMYLIYNLLMYIFFIINILIVFINKLKKKEIKIVSIFPKICIISILINFIIKKNIIRNTSYSKKLYFNLYNENLKEFISIEIKDKKNNIKYLQNDLNNYINYLQKVVYIVNKEVYNFVYKNIIEIKKKLGFLLNKKELLDEYIRLGRLLLYQNLSGIEKKNLEKKKENLFKEWQELEKLEKNLYFLGLYFDVEEFYFPGRNDFRGRYYFDNNVLNLQNDKMIRGFIKFRYYSIFDLKWFKIAFISLYGIKLKTKDDYLIKFDELETEIIELNLDFIFNSENPWQILAYSLEYIDYLEWKADECNENKVYETNLPIFFDATCSVGQLVSLLVGNKKYLGALNLVEKGEEGLGDIYIVLIKEFLDGLNGLESEEDIILCKNLNKRISFTNLQVWRKYLKHTLMPIFYGLTDKGMRSNLIRDSNKLNLKLNIDLINFIWINLVKFKDNNSFFRVLFLINEVFEIEKNVALKFYVNNKGFVTNKQDNMMTLLLNYEEIDKKIIVLDKIIQGERIKKTATFLLSKGLVDNEKQLLALKANLIHTLDALWLHLTAIHCEKLGVKDLIPLFDCLGCQFGDIDKVLYSFKYALGAVFSNKEQFLNILINIKKSQNNGICTNEEKFRLKQLVEGYSDELNIDFLNLDYVVFP